LIGYENKLQLKKKNADSALIKKSLLKKFDVIKCKVNNNDIELYINDIEKEIMENL
jgi:hypothetical protein